jgi:sec-independent protein translocase protein TatA
MGGFSIWHWLVVGIIILLLFGKGRFSEMMGDVAKGLKSFKKGISEEDNPPPAAAPKRIADERTVDSAPVAPTATPAAPPPEERREG